MSLLCNSVDSVRQQAHILVDILMIWHAFMLNPHDYLQDCLRQDMMSLWQRGIPWTFIDEAIDTDTGLYTVSIQHQQSFEVLLSTNSGPMTHWDNLHDDVEKVVECPKCQYEVISNPGQERVAWTETGVAFAATASKLTRTKGHPPRSRSQQEKDAKAVQEAAECGTGFADRDFSVQCRRCHTRIDHEAMRAGSFLMDAVSWKLPLNRIRNHFEQKGASGSVPMKGTLLSGDGTPIEGYGGSRDDTGRSFANKLVAGIMVNRTPNTCWSSMAYTRQQIEMSLKDWSVLEYAMRTSKSRIFVPRANRMSVRRMMSKYWNNASIFSTDLAAACIRQGSFVEKMSEIDWLHSPAVAATMPRLIIKYQRFFDIMSSYPKDMTVPTLDVDLAWHTHQLMPRSYYDYSLKQTGGRFIDHDDKVGEIKLSTSFAKTSERYQKMYNEPYSQCTCWYCEAIRAEHTSNVSRLLHPASNKSIDAQLHSAGESGVHISAHSVIRPQLPRSGTYRYRGAIENYEKKLRAAYDKACKRARKEGRPPPAPPRALDERSSSSSERKDPNTHDAYLYSLALYPFPVGYVPAPYAVAPAACPGMYLADPGCATAVPGAVGNCAAGTCGAGVAAGAGAGAGSLCAGTHFGGCVGGAMAGGGCGGGGGGGCGGGGGGGCGGGGA